MRVGKSSVHDAMAKVAQTLIEAGGEDGKITSAEVAQQLESLEGTERDLADIFFKYVEHRSGGSVTSCDINSALDFAKDNLIDKYDLNNNGLSKSEVSQMSRTGRLAVQLAQELKEVGPSTPTQSAEALANTFEAKADGLLYMSEGDEPYDAFHMSAPNGSDTNWDVETFRQSMGIAPDMEISSDSFDEFFAEPSVYEDSEYAQYEDVANSMRENLTDLQVLRVGGDDVVEGHIYIVGKNQDGDLAGLKTSRIWT